MSEGLRTMIERYNAAWNDHDVDAIMSMHSPSMVFENHTAGETAEGEAVREHVARIFESWPDLAFETRRMYIREDLVVQEWTASATHSQRIERGTIAAEPTGRRVSWRGLDVIPCEDGLIARKDVYSDSMAILRQVGLLDV
jgi:steroid delta-isomerase-like uncharacterized protein